MLDLEAKGKRLLWTFNLLVFQLFLFNYLLQIKSDHVALEMPLSYQLLFIFGISCIIDSIDQRDSIFNVFVVSVSIVLILYAYAGSLLKYTFLFLVVGPSVAACIVKIISHETIDRSVRN